MAALPRKKVMAGLRRVAEATTTHEKGRALEDFVCLLFPLVPGIEIAERNAMNAFQTEEVDVALWNEQHQNGFYFLPNVILIECKNWSVAVGSQEVSYFIGRLRQRGCEYGILFAANGITGVREDLTRAHFEIATALTSGIRIIIITPEDIHGLHDTNSLVVFDEEEIVSARSRRDLHMTETLRILTWGPQRGEPQNSPSGAKHCLRTSAVSLMFQ